MVVSKKVYSPQRYLNILIDDCYIVNRDNDVEFIEDILRSRHIELWNYPLDEIDHIVENDIKVVLVDCVAYNHGENKYVHEYRWFEVPDDFNE